MKKVTLVLTGLQSLADGRHVLVVKPNADYKQEAVVLNAGGIDRLAQRTIGFSGPAAIMALKKAIAVSNGSASITFDQELCKAGEAWKNDVTGETGIYGEKNGQKDWYRSSNHEVSLGIAADMKLLEMAASIGLSQALTAAPVVAPARKELGIAGVPAGAEAPQP